MNKLFKKVLTVATLCLASFAIAGAAKANAGITYDPIADTIKSDTAQVAYVFSKGDKDTKIKADTEGIALAANTAVSVTEDLGIKVAKDIHLYTADAAPTEDVVVKSNYNLSAQQAKKLTAVIDYTKADDAAATNVLSAVALDADKKPIENPVIYWAEEEAGTYAAANTFTGAKLAGMLENGGTIYIKMIGNADYRTSKVYKVKIAKQAKAPSVKIDVKKNTIALKNGYDFVLAAKTGENYALAENATWFTVLPYLKDSGNAVAIASGYTPLDKKDAAAKTSATAYTKTKVKALSLLDFAKKLGKSDLKADFSFGVRKSATNKKPASAVSYYDLAGQKAAPSIYTEQNTSSYDIIAQGADVKFKALDIVNSTLPKTEGGLAWDGIGAEVKPAADAVVDGTAAKYEMAVILKADLDNVDWSTVAWKAIKKGTSITEKTSTKYCLTGSTTKKQAAFTKTNAATEKGSANAKAVLLIRRAGVKGKTINDCVLASEYMTTYLFKTTGADGKAVFQWITEGAKVGAHAFKYVITVNTWQDGAWKADATKTITGYGLADNSVEYTFVDPEGFVYDLSGEIGATVSGKKITIAGGAKDATKDVTVKLQQKAKIKVKYVVPTGDDKIAESEIEMLLGVAQDIADKVNKTGYTAEVKIGTTTVTPADGKYMATAVTAKDIITVTYAKASN